MTLRSFRLRLLIGSVLWTLGLLFVAHVLSLAVLHHMDARQLVQVIYLDRDHAAMPGEQWQHASKRGVDRRTAAVQQQEGHAVAAAVHLVVHVNAVNGRVACGHGRDHIHAGTSANVARPGSESRPYHRRTWPGSEGRPYRRSTWPGVRREM